MKYGSSVSTLAVYAVSACVMFAQQITPPRNFEYDVVSIRPAKADAGGTHVSGSRDSLLVDGSLASLVRYAFGVIMPSQIVGLPEWTESARYEVNAKIDDDTLAALEKLPSPQRSEERQRMCVGILVDRFGLKYHPDSKKLSVYDLVVAKGGAKLKKSDSQGESSSMSNAALKGTGMTTVDLANRLSRRVGRVVVDKTGLTGRFDLELNWTIGPEADGDTQADLFRAIQDQLGLKLVSSQEPVAIVVIDSLTKPSGN